MKHYFSRPAARPQEAVVDLEAARKRKPNPRRNTRNTTYLLGRAYAALGKRKETNALLAQLDDQHDFDEEPRRSDRLWRTEGGDCPSSLVGTPSDNNCAGD